MIYKSAIERLKGVKRSRIGEDIIPLEYLNFCNDYHDTMISLYEENQILFIDGNMDIHSEPQILESWLQQIEEIMCNDV